MPVTKYTDRLEIPAADAIFQAGDFAGSGAILAAVSGGGDSLALLFLLQEYLRKQGQENRLIAVTIDHDLRPESADEAAYVGELCRKSGIKHTILRWEGQKPQTGLQAAARAARYALLAQAAEKYKADSICTAHTLDDQAETYFMRKARLPEAIEGEGFAALRQRGLAGMARSSLLYGKFRLLRPLLEVKRADLRAFLQDKTIGWLDDPSNENRHYERVRIRRNLNAAAQERSCEAVREAAALRQNLSAAAALWGEKLALKREGEALLLDLTVLQAENGLKEQDFAALYLLLAFAAAFCGGKNFIAPNNARLRHFLQILPHRQKGEKPARISVSGAVLEKRQGKMTVKREKRNFPEAAAKEKQVPAQGGAPFGFMISAYDRPLFLLFRPLASG